MQNCHGIQKKQLPDAPEEPEVEDPVRCIPADQAEQQDTVEEPEEHPGTIEEPEEPAAVQEAAVVHGKRSTAARDFAVVAVERMHEAAVHHLLADTDVEESGSENPYYPPNALLTGKPGSP